MCCVHNTNSMESDVIKSLFVSDNHISDDIHEVTVSTQFCSDTQYCHIGERKVNFPLNSNHELKMFKKSAQCFFSWVLPVQNTCLSLCGLHPIHCKAEVPFSLGLHCKVEQELGQLAHLDNNSSLRFSKLYKLTRDIFLVKAEMSSIMGSTSQYVCA